MSTRRTLEQEYFGFLREEAERRHALARRPHEAARADEPADDTAKEVQAYCPACDTPLTASALDAGGECSACAGYSLRGRRGVHEAPQRGIRRRLVDFFFL
jgi:hypothetical protein